MCRDFLVRRLAWLCFCVLFLFGSTPGLRAEGPAFTEAEAREVFRDFPKAYWYALDARYKSGAYTKPDDDPVTFVNKIELRDFSISEAGGKVTVKFAMIEDGDTNRYRTFAFERVGNRWITTGFVAIDGNERNDIYGVNAPILLFRPFIQKELDQMVQKQGIYGVDFRKAPTIDPPKYTSLVGEGLSGSGFHLVWKDKRFVVSTRHQFASGTPKVFSSMDKRGEVRITRRVHDTIDVQVLKYESDWLDSQPALPYAPPSKPQVGDPVFVLEVDTWVPGHIVAVNREEFSIQMEKPIAAAGLSGSPILSGLTGQVVAVLRTADDAQKAKVVGAQTLSLPPRILVELPFDRVPSDLFGVPAKTAVSRELAEFVQSRLIDPGVLQAKLGMSPGELRALRPEISDTYPEDTLFYRPGIGPDGARLRYVEASSFRNPTPEEMQKLVEFVVSYFGPPDRVLGKEMSPTKRGDGFILLFWTNDKFTARLSFYKVDRKMMRCYLAIDASKYVLEKSINMTDARDLEIKPEEIAGEVRWRGEQYLESPEAP
jgi:hypothetical protein